MKIHIASDHAGFELKNTIRDYLKEKGIIDKVIELKARFVEIYDKDEHIPYGGNQMFFGDD